MKLLNLKKNKELLEDYLTVQIPKDRFPVKRGKIRQYIPAESKGAIYIDNLVIPADSVIFDEQEKVFLVQLNLGFYMKNFGEELEAWEIAEINEMITDSNKLVFLY